MEKNKVMNKTLNELTVRDGVKIYLTYVWLQAAGTLALPYLKKLENKIKDKTMDLELRQITSEK